MEGDRPHIAEVIPKAGLVYSEKGQLGETLSKPKIMPLKSISLERIEAMEREAKQLAENPNVDIQYQVAPPDFVHVMVRGRTEIVTDPEEKKRVWDVIDYDLAQFWPGGPTDPNYTLVRVEPERVELSKMFGMQDKRVWRRS